MHINVRNSSAIRNYINIRKKWKYIKYTYSNKIHIYWLKSFFFFFLKFCKKEMTKVCLLMTQILARKMGIYDR